MPRLHESGFSRLPNWVKGVVPVLLLLIASPLPAARRKSEAEPSEHRTPKIALTASPAFGFSPLSVQLVATLSGIHAGDANFCHAGVTWIRIDPDSGADTGTKLSEDPGCVHGEGEVSVATTFSKSFDLYAPGSYLYRVIVDGKDGTQVKSNFVKVRVIRVP